MNTNESKTDGAPLAPPTPSSEGFSRRSFLRRSAIFGAAALPMAGLLSRVSLGQTSTGTTSDSADLPILQFLLAAESIETDLWQQYTELAINNPSYRSALQNIDENLPEYIFEDFRDEKSHRDFLSAYITSLGATPVDLSGFATLQGSTATGSSGIGRVTNLKNLTVDTSYFNRYRSHGNPDFGDTFGQVANIVGRPTIPPYNGIGAAEMDQIAIAAAFHFGFIEAGGSSLYGNLSLYAQTFDAAQVMGAIGPTEFYHLATFMTSLQGVLPSMPAVTADSMPTPCKFLSASLPDNSILRPTGKMHAGAIAAANSLIADNLFSRQSNAFFNAVASLATNADAVTPVLPAGGTTPTADTPATYIY